MYVYMRIVYMRRYVTMMPRLRQALIEFENMEDAINCVQSCQVWVCLRLGSFLRLSISIPPSLLLTPDQDIS